MHGLIFETSIWLLAGSTRCILDASLAFDEILSYLYLNNLRHQMPRMTQLSTPEIHEPRISAATITWSLHNQCCREVAPWDFLCPTLDDKPSRSVPINPIHGHCVATRCHWSGRCQENCESDTPLCYLLRRDEIICNSTSSRWSAVLLVSCKPLLSHDRKAQQCSALVHASAPSDSRVKEILGIWWPQISVMEGFISDESLFLMRFCWPQISVMEAFISDDRPSQEASGSRILHFCWPQSALNNCKIFGIKSQN